MKFKRVTSVFLAVVMTLSFFISINKTNAQGYNYTLVTSVKVYSNASDAAKKINSVGTYSKGEYYIYRTYNGMINISKTQNQPGGWINPTENKADSVVASEKRIVNTKTLIVRSQASSNSNILGYTSLDTKYVGTKIGAWFKINFNGKTGYIAYTFTRPEVEEEKPTPTPDPIEEKKTRIVNVDKLLVRESNSSTSKSIGILTRDTQIDGEKIGAWFKFNYNGEIAYTAYIFTRPVDVEEPIEDPEPETQQETRYVSSSRLAVRENSSSTSKILGFIYKADKLEGEKAGAWFKTTFNGKVAYVAYSFTSDKLPEPYELRTVSSNKLVVRSEANSTSNILAIVEKGYEFIGIKEGAWFNTKYMGKQAFIAYMFTQGIEPTIDNPEINDEDIIIEEPQGDTDLEEVIKDSEPINISEIDIPKAQEGLVTLEDKIVIEDGQKVYYKYIVGKAEATEEQMLSYLEKVNSNLTDEQRQYAKIYLQEGAAEGIRGDIAFAQSLLETGNFKFGGDVTPDQNNFSGLGATGGGVKGNYFTSPREGIRAQIQHLKAYANNEPLNLACVDTRFTYVTRGTSEFVQWLGIQENPGGYGWAAGAGYGQAIIKILNEILEQ